MTMLLGSNAIKMRNSYSACSKIKVFGMLVLIADGRIADGRTVLMAFAGHAPAFLAAGTNRTNTCDKAPVHLL